MTIKRRPPKAVRLDDPTVHPVEMASSPSSLSVADELPQKTKKRRWHLGLIITSTLAALTSLALGLAIDQLIRDLFVRYDLLGWIGLGLVSLFVIALCALILREIIALMRLRRIDALRSRAETAIETNNDKEARVILHDLDTLYAERAETARGRATLATHLNEIIDGRDLIPLAERDLLTPLDAKAYRLVRDAAKRVSLVTAISPRALVDILFVGAQSLRLIRQISTLYGGRPGTLGFLSLTRHVLSHLALTGGIAMSEGLLQQALGHGLATRISARLGEGVINGLLTARVGLAAIDVCRPLPFIATERPGIGDILSILISSDEANETSSAKTAEKTKNKE